MPQRRRPRLGSIAYSPRKRAKSPLARISSWPAIEGSPKILGFAGYKAGMTHAIMIDYRPTSTTAGQEVQVPVTVLEVPPLRVCAVRVYREGPYGKRTLTEKWASNLERNLTRKLPISRKGGSSEDRLSQLKEEDFDDVRILVYTQPNRITGTPTKTPEIMELGLGGGTLSERLEYARSLLGKEVNITDFTSEGDMVDVVAITKGKGFQGVTKRWGTKLLMHKNSKHRRMIGNLGPKRPGYVRPTVPQAGQTGFHQRTEHNKRILKIGENGSEITPKGGFLKYGDVRNKYVLIHGTIPGSTKRTVRLKEPSRLEGVELTEAPQLVYISVESKQGA